MLPTPSSNIFSNIDWGATSVGAIAFLVSLAALFLQNRHNRLSVTPIGLIKVSDFLDKTAVLIQNKGAGPLIVKSLTVVDGSGRRERTLIRLFETGFDGVRWRNYVEEIDGWALLPGESQVLIEYEGNPMDSASMRVRTAIREVLAHVTIELRYQDIYKTNFPANIRKLDFFADDR